MSPWRGGRLPHLSFVPRKPEPLGVELKMCCNATTGVMLFGEICEGKERMPLKKYEEKYAHTVATTLRLIEPYANTDRAIYGDSWFASVRNTVALKKEFGLYFVGDVKTAHQMFPRKALARTPADKGAWLKYTAKHKGVDIFALGHRKGKSRVGMLVASCGTTTEGERLAYAYTEDSTGGLRLGGDRANMYTVG
mmetsp:Transcript_17760/g.41335  ORF Transcript_17760/g.41335 Transcript_17760/m.41335 type:complete len:194 (-) Transcript_17760:706-1287(-)